ncbi:hypothetical protein WICPIJ_002101 [Wickerhamomyces pijperi]|uniref:Uncharacterized protein n=1 Tax=Wickerhamomyces pijperi TaxID=599730 RepID=A0A9P8QC35_WICPI|nr:hypothetical protein WICPIJ_002101 [Wickerhamomyces pijperi]
MPPKTSVKKQPVKTTTVQLKRLTQTFFLTLQHPITLQSITEQLHEMISLTGGLYDMTSEEWNEQDELDGEEDIEIPVPEFGELADADADVEDEPMVSNTGKSDVTDVLIPEIEQLKIARCVNSHDPYANEWQTFLDSDSSLDDLVEFEVLGFAVDGVDEKLSITEGQVGGGEYEDDE